MAVGMYDSCGNEMSHKQIKVKSIIKSKFSDKCRRHNKTKDLRLRL